jgi:bifunctional DNase/RNase
VLLQETGGDQRILGIGIGNFEGDALLILLSGVEVQRPLTFMVTRNLLETVGGRVREVRINRLAEETFLAETVIQTPDGQERVVDSRPSDAIYLAIVARAPIRVAEPLLQDLGETQTQVNARLTPDGERVLDKQMIAASMERTRRVREAEDEKVMKDMRQRREARHRQKRSC